VYDNKKRILIVKYGLYSAIMGVFVYVVLGTVKEASVGPTAVMSLMTFSYANEGGPAYAALLCFLAGWIELFAGILNLGNNFMRLMLKFDCKIFFSLQGFWSNSYRRLSSADFVQQLL